jgi:hypothetical protein
MVSAQRKAEDANEMGHDFISVIQAFHGRTKENNDKNSDNRFPVTAIT